MQSVRHWPLHEISGHHRHNKSPVVSRSSVHSTDFAAASSASVGGAGLLG